LTEDTVPADALTEVLNTALAKDAVSFEQYDKAWSLAVSKGLAQPRVVANKSPQTDALIYDMLEKLNTELAELNCNAKLTICFVVRSNAGTPVVSVNGINVLRMCDRAYQSLPYELRYSPDDTSRQYAYTTDAKAWLMRYNE
tara:strand:- start:2677 stop:3102 length:426 start_codon:yes stop_codon:yes gene_type:complete